MTGSRLVLAAPAKINLYLKITGRRPDGYHELQTLMQKLALFDQIVIERTGTPGITLQCPGSGLPVDDGNIVYRAAALFCRKMGINNPDLHIVIKKQIPLSAGLGGGSSNAATVLYGLARLFEIDCSTRQLATMGMSLGADVPLFVHRKMAAAWATGIGEQLKEAASLTRYLVLLVNPGIPVSTKWAFETFALTSIKKKINLSNSQKVHYCGDRSMVNGGQDFQPDYLYNDLESVTAEKYHEIDKIKHKLLAGGAAGAMMSGSGSTVFGLFPVELCHQAEQCRLQCKKEYDQVYLVDPLSEEVNRVQ